MVCAGQLSDVASVHLQRNTGNGSCLCYGIVKGIKSAFPLQVNKRQSQDAVLNRHLVPMIEYALEHVDETDAPALQRVGFKVDLPCDAAGFAAAVKKYKETDEAYTDLVNWGSLEMWLIAKACGGYFGADSKVVGFVVINMTEQQGLEHAMPAITTLSPAPFDQWQVEIAVNFCAVGEDSTPQHYDSFYHEIGTEKAFSWNVSHLSVARRSQRHEEMAALALTKRQIEDQKHGREEYSPSSE
jgi:hypothetical protein